MVEVTLTSMGSEIAAKLVNNSLIGAFIGTISMFAFMYIFEVKEIDIKIAFMVIGIIPSVPSIYLYLIQNL